MLTVGPPRLRHADSRARLGAAPRLDEAPLLDISGFELEPVWRKRGCTHFAEVRLRLRLLGSGLGSGVIKAVGLGRGLRLRLWQTGQTRKPGPGPNPNPDPGARTPTRPLSKPQPYGSPSPTLTRWRISSRGNHAPLSTVYGSKG